MKSDIIIGHMNRCICTEVNGGDKLLSLLNTTCKKPKG